MAFSTGCEIIIPGRTAMVLLTHRVVISNHVKPVVDGQYPHTCATGAKQGLEIGGSERRGVLMNPKDIGPINVTEIQRLLVKDESGFVSINRDALDMNMISDRFAYGLSSHGGGLYGRVKATDERVSKNARRPEGSSPVRGSGLRQFGAPVGLGTGDGELSREEQAKLIKRRDAIRKSQADNLAAMKEHMYATSDPKLTCVADCEMHQLKTGGGYDNTTATDYYTTIGNFVRRAETLPQPDEDMRRVVVKACEEFRDHLVQCGFRYGSLKPTPFVKVRDDQSKLSKDGTMGWPVLKKSMQPFTENESRAIKSQYDIDLSYLVGSEVNDGYGYVGKARCCDAVAELISQYEYTPAKLIPLYVLFQRIQRHGWKDETCTEPKNGKARAIYVPDVVWGGGVGAMVGDAWQRELEAHHVPDFPSLMNPDDQKATVSKLVELAATNDLVVLSADESGYDQSLLSSVMATIMEICVKPFFEESYHAAVDVATMSLVYKVLVVDEAEFSRVELGEGHEALEKAKSRDGHLLIPVTNGGLVSGHKFTMAMGSMYGVVVLQRGMHIALGFDIPEDQPRGVMAGDDNCVVYPRNSLDMSSEATAYAVLSEYYAKWGIEVNPNKQLWIVYDDEPVTQFLQKIYHSKLGIHGFGSAARCLQQVAFSEYSPTKLNVAEQALAQISVFENGADNPFIDEAIRIWLRTDPRLLNLFQTYGLAAWEVLISQAHMDDKQVRDSILNLESKGAIGMQRSAEDVANDIKLNIVPVIVSTAASEPASRERWLNQDKSIQAKESSPEDVEDWTDEAVETNGETVE